VEEKYILSLKPYNKKVLRLIKINIRSKKLVINDLQVLFSDYGFLNPIF